MILWSISNHSLSLHWVAIVWNLMTFHTQCAEPTYQLIPATVFAPWCITRNSAKAQLPLRLLKLSRGRFMGRLVRQPSNVTLERGSNVTLTAPVLITGVSPKSLGESIALSVALQKPA